MSFNGRPQAFNDTNLVNDGFFPEVNLGEFQRLHRIPSFIADDTVKHQLKLAMANTNITLASKKSEWLDAGETDLAAMDAADNGQRVTLYKSAVFYMAKASALIDFQTFSRRDEASNIAQEGEDTEQKLMAKSRNATRQLLGKAGTIDVELI
jgi:hypothetical protein